MFVKPRSQAPPSQGRRTVCQESNCLNLCRAEGAAWVGCHAAFYSFHSLALRKTNLYYKQPLFTYFKLALGYVSHLSFLKFFKSNFKKTLSSIQVVADFSLLQTLAWQISLYIHICVFVQLFFAVRFLEAELLAQTKLGF